MNRIAIYPTNSNHGYGSKVEHTIEVRGEKSDDVLVIKGVMLSSRQCVYIENFFKNATFVEWHLEPGKRVVREWDPAIPVKL